MPDIREVLAALDENDKKLWSQHRTEIRKSFMNAHNSILGIPAWDAHDDAFIDLIDIKLALLFDRAGKFNTTKALTGDEANKIEKEIHNASSGLKLVNQASEWGSMAQLPKAK